MSEAPPKRLWPYLLAAVLGSLAGALLDVALYPDGGTTLMKIGLVAAPVAVYLIARYRGSKDEDRAARR